MKNFTLFLFITIASYQLFAQQAFYPYTVIDESFGVESPRETKIADIDSDGDLDIFILSYSSSDLVWVENLDGNGNYGPITPISTAYVTASFDIGDINGDGHTDILRGNYGTDKITWHSNDGMGGFNNTNSVDDDFNNPENLILSDIDGDSDLDVFAYSNSGPNKCGWFENLDGLGSFGTFTEIESLGNAGSGGFYIFKIADLDNDDDLDLIISNRQTSTLLWYENIDGLGTFGNAISIDASVAGVKSLRLSDVDGDSDLDILVARDTDTSTTDDYISLYENLDGNANFGAITTITNTVDGAKYVHTDDLDSDGDMDLLVTNTNDNNYLWLENDGSGSFGAPVIFEEYVFQPSHISTADLDNNGTIDIVGTANGEDTISVFKNLDGQEEFGYPIHINSVNLGSTKTVIADIDNDGYNDIVATSVEDSKVSWFKNLDGSNSFSQQNVLVGNASTVGLLEVMDFDYDGDLDIIYGYGNVVNWIEHLDGNGTFNQSETLFIGGASNYKGILLMDTDNDLDTDLITLNFSSQLILHENIDNSIQDNIYISSGMSLKQIHKIDLNGDGYLDLIGSGSTNDHLIWFPNQGDGTFGSFQNLDSGLENIVNSGIEFADFDGDGDLDIVSGSSQNNTVLWYEHLDGMGGFGTAVSLGNNIDMNQALAAFDSDLDGDIDIIVFDTNSNVLFFIENIDGNGNFSDPVELFSTDGVDYSDLTFGHLNADFKPDLLPSTYVDAKILWYENLGILSNVITGNVSLDLLSDGCDPSDLDIQNLLINTSNETYSFSTVSDANGGYSISVTEGNYTTQISSSLPNYYESVPETHTSQFIGSNNIDTKDFCAIATQEINDISIAIFPVTEARPGFMAEYELVYSNNGTTAMSGNVELNYNTSKLSYVSSDQDYTTLELGQIIFDYIDLLPFETRTINVIFQVATPPIAEIDDELVFTAIVHPIIDDITTDNNTFEYTQIVIGSYDPNDILVLEGPEVLIENAEKYLHYTIRFQNTGTASAINVLVTNELHQNLDWTSFKLLNSSHDVEVQIENGNDIQFIFNGIYLPDENTDSEGSNGYVQYKIKPISTVDVGDSITNEARIYFDFNPFILTNTVETTFIQPLSIQDFSHNTPNIYPIPTTGKLFIDNIENYNSVGIFDLSGRLIFEEPISNNEKLLQLEKLNSGIYLLILNDNEGNLNSKRIIKN